MLFSGARKRSNAEVSRDREAGRNFSATGVIDSTSSLIGRLGWGAKMMTLRPINVCSATRNDGGSPHDRVHAGAESCGLTLSPAAGAWPRIGAATRDSLPERRTPVRTRFFAGSRRGVISLHCQYFSIRNSQHEQSRRFLGLQSSSLHRRADAKIDGGALEPAQALRDIPVRALSSRCHRSDGRAEPCATGPDRGRADAGPALARGGDPHHRRPVEQPTCADPPQYRRQGEGAAAMNTRTTNSVQMRAGF
jgi:hypothetical protein